VPWWYCTAQPRRSSLFARAAQRANHQQEIFSLFARAAQRTSSPINFAGLQSEAATINNSARNDAGDVHRHDVRGAAEKQESNGQGDRRQIARCLGANLCAPQGWGSRRR